MKKLLVVFIAALSLTACGTGTTTVVSPAGSKISVATVAVEEGASNVFVPDQDKAYFRKQLEASLYAQGAFSRGSELTLTYRFVQYKEGDRFSRWLTGGIGNAGEASLSIEAVYTKDGHEVGKIVAGGKIGSGLFGGSSDDALDKAAQEIGNYTAATFK